VIIFPMAVHAEGLWSDIKKGASDAADSVSDAAESVTEKESPAETRSKIDSMASATLQRTYMKMATGGVNVGLGGEFFQLVIPFRTRKLSIPL
jgi:hypothetical protein